MAIVNKGSQATTLRDAKLLYRHSGSELELDSTVVHVTTVSENFAAVLVYVPATPTNQQMELYFKNWTNIRHEINKSENKEPGSIWKGSALFVFPPNVVSPDDISELRIKAVDYLGRVGVTKLPYDSSLDMGRRLGARFCLGSFRISGNSVLVE